MEDERRQRGGRRGRKGGKEGEREGREERGRKGRKERGKGRKERGKGEEREKWRMGKMKFHPLPHISTPTHFSQPTSPLTPQASHR